jgi:hypothetical protein
MAASACPRAGPWARSQQHANSASPLRVSHFPHSATPHRVGWWAVPADDDLGGVTVPPGPGEVERLAAQRLRLEAV